MKTYHFEHTDEKRIKTSILLGFGIFFSTTGLAFFTVDKQHIFMFVLLGLLLAGIFFYLNTRKVKQTGTAQLADDYVLLNVFGKQTQIWFEQIKIYQDGSKWDQAYLKLQLIDGSKFMLAAGENFCNPSDFKIFMTDAMQALEKFKSAHPLSQVKEQHPFAAKWLLYMAWGGVVLTTLALIPLIMVGDLLKLGAWLIFAVISYGFLRTIYLARKKDNLMK